MIRYRILGKIAFGMLSLGVTVCGPQVIAGETEPGEGAAEYAREQGAAAWQALGDLYDEAKEAGDEAAPDGIVEWVKDDIAVIGDWEYRVEDVPPDRAEMLKKLNGWGAERWEVYWVEKKRGRKGYTLHLKRAGRSYLRMIPVGSVLPALPGGG